MLTETQRQVARLRAALSELNDETGSMRTREADVAFYRAWGSLVVLERETGTLAALEAERRAREAAAAEAAA